MLQNNPTILIVHDDTVARTLIRLMLLRSTPCTIHEASGGHEAFNCIHNELPDLVIIDNIMRDMYGTELCRQIRVEYDAEELPVIVVSARMHRIDMTKADEYGANRYLKKPILPNELAECIQQLLQ